MLGQAALGTGQETAKADIPNVGSCLAASGEVPPYGAQPELMPKEKVGLSAIPQQRGLVRQAHVERDLGDD